MRRAASGGRVRIGISGWRYEPWRGVFYPAALQQRRELAYAAGCFPSIEINGSFYSLQRPESYLQWHAQTPEDFVFAVKGPKFITHMRRLKDVATPLSNFFASGVLALRGKLGPMLWQLPPHLRYDEERLDAFLGLLPHETDAALELARHHDRWLAGRSWLEAGTSRALRHAIEVRHESFATPAFVAQLRKHRVALVVADTAGRWPLLEDLSADFVYMRLHGDEELYASGYSDEALTRWARRIETWSHGGQAADARLAAPHAASRRKKRDVFCYFDNDVKVHAPYDAARLAALVGLPTPLEAPTHVVPPSLPPPRRRATGFASARR